MVDLTADSDSLSLTDSDALSDSDSLSDGFVPIAHAHLPHNDGDDAFSSDSEAEIIDEVHVVPDADENPVAFVLTRSRMASQS